MKKILWLILMLSLSLPVYNLSAENIHERFKNSPHIRVYLREVTAGRDNDEIEIGLFKQVFKNELRERLNIKFMPVSNLDEADVIIDAHIKDYAFKKKAMPSFFSIPAFVADTTAPKSSASLTVDYQIIDPDDGKVLLRRKNFTTIERRPIEDMAGEQGFIYASEKNINRFIYRSFHEQKRR